MPNQMIALQARGPQLPDLSRQTAQMANMMNMARQAEMAQLQGQRTRQEMQYAEAAEGRAIAGEGRAASKFKMEQAAARVSAVGTGLIGMLRDPSDANLAQTARTFAAVGMDPEEYTGVLSQMAAISDPNARKLYALEFITQSEPARAALKYVMPNVKETKIGDDVTVFTDDNANSATFGQELFRFRVSPKPVELNQQVVGDRVFNINPRTGVAAEATVGDPYQGLNPAERETTFTTSGVRSPYAVGGGAGAGQPAMAPPVAPQGISSPAPAVGGPRGVPVAGAPGKPGKGGVAAALKTNPGALKDGAFARSQPGYTGASAGFATFDTPQAGIAAQERLLANAYVGKGFNTINKIINRYAPQGPENSAASVNNYKSYVARQTGLDMNAPISTNQISAVAKAMREFETGQTQGRGGAGTPTGAGTGTPVTVSEAVKLTGKRRVSSLVADMLKEYDKLNTAKAIGSSGRGVAENIFDYLSVSAPGQEIQKMFGTKANDSLSNLTSSRKLLASAMAAAMGLSSKQADSNTELQLTLASLSDATQGYKAVTDILKRVDREYGMGTASTRTPTTGGAQGKGKPPLKSFRRK